MLQGKKTSAYAKATARQSTFSATAASVGIKGKTGLPSRSSRDQRSNVNTCPPTPRLRRDSLRSHLRRERRLEPRGLRSLASASDNELPALNSVGSTFSKWSLGDYPRLRLGSGL